MSRQETVSLVGLPGSGKSTVGRVLAHRLGWEFFDSDQVIEDDIGRSIRSFFDSEGEEAFRSLEAEVIARLARRSRCVIATGGGAVLRRENREVLREHTCVFYLRASPEDLFRRLRRDTKRPLLQVADPLARLRELHAQRDPLYAEVADFVADTGKSSVVALVAKLSAQLELAGLLRA